jgi:class 3 adenylate cyclase
VIRRGRGERRLATVLFTDIVSSTERAVELGDRGWRALLRRHQRTVRAELRRYAGHEVDSAGDGFFATFAQPAQAVRCALAIRQAVRPLGLSVRSGVHAGEVEPIGPKVGGVAVHLAARVLSAAEPDEILVTSTVRELVAGSELVFEDGGARTFKGFEDRWRVFRVIGPEPSAAAPLAEEPAGMDARARRMAIAAGGVIGAALVTGVLIVLGLGGQAAPTAGVNTVVQIDGANTIASAVAVARAPIALSAGAGALWVASEAGTVTRIDLDTRATQVVGGVGIPSAMAVAGSSAWVAQGYEGRISRIDTETVELRETLELHGRRIAATDEGIWMTDDLADRVIHLSGVTFAELGTVALQAGSGPRGVATDGSTVWVANQRSATLIRIDQASLATVGHPIGLGSPPTEVAVAGGSVWVTSLEADTLYRVDPEQGRVAATIEVCDEPDAIAASADGVWVACRADRVVRRFGLDGSFVADVAIPGVPCALAIVEDGVWVAIRGE